MPLSDIVLLCRWAMPRAILFLATISIITLLLYAISGEPG